MVRMPELCLVDLDPGLSYQEAILLGRECGKVRGKNVTVGLFFSEIGNKLLRSFCVLDPHCNNINEYIQTEQRWSNNDFTNLRKRLNNYEYT